MTIQEAFEHFRQHLGPYLSHLGQFRISCLFNILVFFSDNLGWSMCVGMLVLMCWHVGPGVLACWSWCVGLLILTLFIFMKKTLIYGFLACLTVHYPKSLKTLPLQFESYLVQFISHFGQFSSHFGPFLSKLTHFGSHLLQFRRHLNNLDNIWFHI